MNVTEVPDPAFSRNFQFHGRDPSLKFRPIISTLLTKINLFGPFSNLIQADHNTLADDNEKLINEVEKCHADLENGSEQLEIIRVQLSNSKLNYDNLHEKHSELLEIGRAHV